MKKVFSILLLLSSIVASVLSTTTAQYSFQNDIQSEKDTCVSSNSNCWPSIDAWNALNATVGGNLVAVVPPAKYCYVGDSYNEQRCRAYQTGFTNDMERESYIGTMQNINWESCGKQDSCLLGPVNASLPQSGTCKQGALPRYGLNSTSAQDIAAVIQFAQKHRIAFNIKNTGHDFLGRSTSPDSITVWTHNMQKIEFHESFQTCDKSQSYKAFTFGAGVNWLDAYRAANEKNVTLVGGAQASVGVAGGWLAGGGHSILTPAFGLGVDHVLQFKVVLANGQEVTADKCQNADLFWALRGGGGGSLGVVTEATMRTHPHVTMQFLLLQILTAVPKEQENLLRELTRHSERWAEEGWGGYFYYNDGSIFFLYANPLLPAEEASKSLKPFLDFIDSKSSSYTKKIFKTGTVSGYYEFFMSYMYMSQETVGSAARLSSRLIPREHFATNASRETLVEAFLEGTKVGQPIVSVLPTQILFITSLRVRDEEGETSVQPMFRSSVWHVIYVVGWSQDTPQLTQKEYSKKVNEAANPLRKLTPGSGAYINEADILEPEWHQSFWGPNYDRLIKIKQKYDPSNFFNCWKCLGWDETMASQDKKYRCYKF